MVRREPVPSGVQVAADSTGASVPRVRRRRPRTRAFANGVAGGYVCGRMRTATVRLRVPSMDAVAAR